jgi:hypothetical protein
MEEKAMSLDDSHDAVLAEHALRPGRHDFHLLLAANPNYFGTFPGLGFDPVELKANDTFYEDVTCVAYSPERDRVEATIAVKQAAGYAGGPCSPGSFEYVRFYIDYGTGWEDLGLATVNVHDLPVETDCFGSPTHPLSYVVGLDHKPRRKWCATPVLPVVRAILSWDLQPPAGQPDWTPVWGGVHECRVQITPRPWFFGDIASLLTAEVLAQVPASVLDAPPLTGPDPGPKKALNLVALAESYRGTHVPVHRFAMPAVLTASHLASESEFLNSAIAVHSAGVDLAEVQKALQATSGNTEFEELECLGLDSVLFGGSLVATFRVKKSVGYSGPPCSAGSTEYVAFWADWGDDCAFRYLGTVPVASHDYQNIGGGLCYAAVLPVELGQFLQGCDKPNLRRVRAVLSWNKLPSTTDPDALPYWGNRLDAHVQIPPGQPYDGLARFWKVGGVAAQFIDPVSGLTLPGAMLESTFSLTPLPDACPFAGEVAVFARQDPTLTGQLYRIVATNLDHGGTRILTSPFPVTRYDSGTNSYVPGTITPDPVTGWLPWPSYLEDLEGLFGVFAPGGDDRWSLALELGTPGNQVDQATVRMDNTIRNYVDPSDPVNVGDLHLNTEGMCKVQHGLVTGTFVADDEHFWQWSITVLGGPGPAIPPIPLSPTTYLTPAPLPGTAFSLNFTDPLIAPCGYVVRLTIWDKAIVDSVEQTHYTTVDRGLCLM